jgi:hypothetical protein
MLRKRFVIETINNRLKDISQIEHSRHRSLTGFIVNLVGGLFRPVSLGLDATCLQI